MKYYQFRNTVIKVDDSANYKDIVNKMRATCNVNMMIEDIHKCDVEDYIEYLEESIDKNNNLVNSYSKLIDKLKKDSNQNLPF